jgi:Xaa-Pro aminopeptidase
MPDRVSFTGDLERRSARMDALQRKVLKKVDAFLVLDLTGIRYLTGFTGSSGMLFLSRGHRVFMSDFRYEEQARQEVGDVAKVVITSKGPKSSVRRLISGLRIGKLGFETSMPFSFYDFIRGGVSEMVPFQDAVLSLRAVKDEGEAGLLREAVRRAEEAFGAVKPRIKAGMTERSIAQRLGEKLRKLGSLRLPFDIIVASGPNSSRPHAGATGRKIGPGDLLTIDWGAEAGGYFSDMTRTFLLKGGRGLQKKKEIYDVVLKANRRAIKAVRAGIGLRALDNVARSFIEKRGYGERFGHGLGHGVGLDVHELPSVSRYAKGKVRASEVFTIEPGVYVPELGGVRIEDMVLAGSEGCEVLTSLPRTLETI